MGEPTVRGTPAEVGRSGISKLLILRHLIRATTVVAAPLDRSPATREAL
jgi:hypothetical protein